MNPPFHIKCGRSSTTQLCLIPSNVHTNCTSMHHRCRCHPITMLPPPPITGVGAGTAALESSIANLSFSMNTMLDGFKTELTAVIDSKVAALKTEMVDIFSVVSSQVRPSDALNPNSNPMGTELLPQALLTPPGPWHGLNNPYLNKMSICLKHNQI